MGWGVPLATHPRRVGVDRTIEEMVVTLFVHPLIGLTVYRSFFPLCEWRMDVMFLGVEFTLGGLGH